MAAPRMAAPSEAAPGERGGAVIVTALL